MLQLHAACSHGCSHDDRPTEVGIACPDFGMPNVGRNGRLSAADGVQPLTAAVAQRIMQTPNHYHWYSDGLLWVGLATVALGAYIFLRLFAFPGLWLPGIRTRSPLEFDFEALHPASATSAVVHVRFVNKDRDYVDDAFVFFPDVPNHTLHPSCTACRKLGSPAVGLGPRRRDRQCRLTPPELVLVE